MKKNKEKEIEELIQGIKALLSTDRCSLNDEDKVLLQSCIAMLRKAKRKDDFRELMSGLTMLAKFFTVAKGFIELLS